MSATIGHAGVEVVMTNVGTPRRPTYELTVAGARVGVLRRLRHGRWVVTCECGAELPDVDPVTPVMGLIDHRQEVGHEQ